MRHHVLDARRLGLVLDAQSAQLGLRATWKPFSENSKFWSIILVNKDRRNRGADFILGSVSSTVPENRSVVS